jgi:hypothetical protein
MKLNLLVLVHMIYMAILPGKNTQMPATLSVLCSQNKQITVSVFKTFLNEKRFLYFYQILDLLLKTLNISTIVYSQMASIRHFCRFYGEKLCERSYGRVFRHYCIVSLYGVNSIKLLINARRSNMSNMISFEEVKKRILIIRGQQVLLDSSVADFYGVETKRVNEAVANNPDKFPEGYIISLDLSEWSDLKSKLSTSSWGGKNKPPKAFTEKGLYMLATILKSPSATQTTLAIVETFAKIREFAKIITQLPDVQEESEQKVLLQRSGDIFTDILDDNLLEVCGDEITFELDLAVVKVKHTVKRKKRK